MTLFSMPMSLNSSAAIAITTKNGTPCAKYSVGTQVMGERLSGPAGVAGSGAAPAVMTDSLCTLGLFPGGGGARYDTGARQSAEVQAARGERFTGDFAVACARPSSHARTASSAPSQ